MLSSRFIISSFVKNHKSLLLSSYFVRGKKMVSRDKLSDSQREVLLKPLLESGWTVLKDKDALYKEYKFENFIKAFGFMTSLAIYAEKHDHHPEWFNVYNKVQITLNTHTANGISQYDVNFASFADSLLNKS